MSHAFRHLRFIPLAMLLTLVSAAAPAAVCNFANNTPPSFSGMASGDITDLPEVPSGPNTVLKDICGINGPWDGWVSIDVVRVGAGPDKGMERLTVNTQIKHLIAPDAHARPGASFLDFYALDLPMFQTIADLRADVGYYGGTVSFLDRETVRVEINRQHVLRDHPDDHTDVYDSTVIIDIFGRHPTKPDVIATPLVTKWSISLSGHHRIADVPLPLPGAMLLVAMGFVGVRSARHGSGGRGRQIRRMAPA